MSDLAEVESKCVWGGGGEEGDNLLTDLSWEDRDLDVCGGTFEVAFWRRLQCPQLGA